MWSLHRNLIPMEYQYHFRRCKLNMNILQIFSRIFSYLRIILLRVIKMILSSNSSRVAKVIRRTSLSLRLKYTKMIVRQLDPRILLIMTKITTTITALQISLFLNLSKTSASILNFSKKLCIAKHMDYTEKSDFQRRNASGNHCISCSIKSSQ